MTAALENIDEADEVAIDIGVRIRHGISHSRLRREVDHFVESLALEQAWHRRTIRDVHPFELKPGIGGELGEPGFLEPDVVIVVEVVDPDDFIALFKEPRGYMRSDEPRRTG